MRSSHVISSAQTMEVDDLLLCDWNENVRSCPTNSPFTQDLAILPNIVPFKPVNSDWLPLVNYLLRYLHNQAIRAEVVQDYPAYVAGDVGIYEEITLFINRSDLKDRFFNLLTTDPFSIQSYEFEPILHGCINPDPYFNIYNWSIRHKKSPHSVKLFIVLFTRNEHGSRLEFIRDTLMNYNNRKYREDPARGNNRMIIAGPSTCHYLEHEKPFCYTEIPWINPFKPLHQEWLPIAFYMLNLLYVNQIQGGIFGDYPAFVSGRLKTFQSMNVYVNRKDWKEIRLFSNSPFSYFPYNFEPVYHPHVDAFPDVFHLYTWKVTDGYTKKTMYVNILLYDPKTNLSLLEFIHTQWDNSDFPWLHYAIIGVPYCVFVKDVQCQGWLKKKFCPIGITQRILPYKKKVNCLLSEEEIQQHKSCHQCRICQPPLSLN